MRWTSLLGLLLLALLGARPAAAHPESSDAWGHQLEVALDPDAVVVELTVEVPVLRAAGLLAEALEGVESPDRSDQAAFDQAFRQDLLDNLRLTADGNPLKLTAAPAEAPDNADRRFVVWRVRATAGLPAGPAVLQLSHGAWPMEKAVYRTSVWVDDAVALRGSSLVLVRDGGLVDTDGLWRPDPSVRDIRLAVERRDGLSAAAFGGWRRLVTPAASWTARAPQVEVVEGASPGLRRLMSAAPDRHWRATAAALLLGLVGGLLPVHAGAWAGLAVRGRRRSALGWGIAVFALSVVAGAVGPSATSVAVQQGVAALLLAAAGVRLLLRREAALLAAAAAALAPLPMVREAAPLALTIGDPLLMGCMVAAAAVGVAAGFVTAALVGRRLPERITGAVLLLLALVPLAQVVTGQR